MRLAVLGDAFDNPDWIFELKYDGFRAIAEVRGGTCYLYSRNRNVYKRFPTVCRDVAASTNADAVLDGEIVSLDAEGRPQFYDLLRRRGNPVFIAFDILDLNGRDLRNLSLIERKRILRSVVPKSGPVLYAGHIDGRGTDLYRETCRRDLEGIVAKWKHGHYVPGDEQPTGRTLARLVHNPNAIRKYTWLKIKNRQYTQMDGRSELFEQRA